jgi:hypothetical protein
LSTVSAIIFLKNSCSSVNAKSMCSSLCAPG